VDAHPRLGGRQRVLAAWSTLGPVAAERGLGGAAAWGTVLAAGGAGSVVGALVAVRARPARPLVLVAAATVVFALPLAGLAAGLPVPALAAAAFASGVALVLGTSTSEATLQRAVPAAARSRVASFDHFGSLLLAPIGFAVWGPAAAALGLTAALWTAFALLAVSGLALLAVPEVRALRG